MLTVQQAIDLACQHHQAGRLAEAEALYRQVLAVEPNHADALHFLGIVAQQLGHHDLAAECIHRAIAVKPNVPAAHSNLGEAFRALNRLDEAIAQYRLALELKPDYPVAYNNLGIALAERGQFSDAIAAHRRALELKPDYAEAHNNLGIVLADTGQFQEARTAFQTALQIKPAYADARFNLSLLLLLHGDFEQGLPLYEARTEVFRSARQHFTQPLWDRKLLAGETVLIHAEQGLGDSIQFVRYAKSVADAGGSVILVCQRSLVELFRGVQGVSRVIAAGDPLPPFDFHLPMLSQPLVLQTRRESIPAEIPYLFAKPGRCELWKKLLGDSRPGLRVGLAWAGRSENRRNRMRNIPIGMLSPLLRVNDAEFFSLQIDPESCHIENFSGTAAIIDHTKHIQDFADTAGFMAELDLIISVDTAVAHLAGALGRPVWTLLPFVPDWRWGLGREDTPWYPTMRLFRQPALGDWGAVIQRVAVELERLAATRRSS